MSLPVPGPDRTALVTGASSGIGVELARQLAGRGHGVTLVARREDKLRALADELAANAGVRTEVIAADLTDAASREGIVRQLDERGLEVDILVNNAGFSTMGPVQRSDPEREVAMVQTDVEAVVHLCSLVIPGMASRGRGAVLNVASTAAFQPIPGQAGYAASKAFVLSYSRAIGQELKGTGVTVTTLCPGPVETGFAEAAGLGDDRRRRGDAQAHVGERGGRGQGRGGRPRHGPAGGHPGHRQPSACLHLPPLAPPRPPRAAGPPAPRSEGVSCLSACSGLAVEP